MAIGGSVQATAPATPNPVLEAAAKDTANRTAAANAALENSRVLIEANRAAQEANMANQSGLGATIRSAIMDTAKNDAIIEEATLIKQQKVDQYTIKVTEDVASPENMSRQITDLLESEKEFKAAQEKLQAETADQGMLESFIMGTLNETVYGNRAGKTGLEVEQAAIKFETAHAAVQRSSAAVDAAANVAAKTHSAINEATINASLRNIEAKARQAAAVSDLEIARTNGSALSAIAQDDARTLDTYITQYSMASDTQARLEQNERFKLQYAQDEANFKMRQQEFILAKGNAERTAELVRQEKEYEELAVLNVQKAQASAGGTIQEVPMILSGLRAGGDEGAYYRKLAVIGATATPTTGPIWADNAYDAAKTYAAIPGANSPQAKYFEEATRRVNEKYTVVDETTGTKTIKLPTNEEDLKAVYNATIEEMDAEFAANAESGDKNNWHALPPASTVLTAPAVQKTKLYDAVLKHYSATHIEAKGVLEMTAAAVTAKTISPDQAARDLQTVFKTAKGLTLADGGGILRAGIPTSRVGKHLVNIEVAASRLDGLTTILSAPAGPAVFGVIPGYKEALLDVGYNNIIKGRRVNTYDMLKLSDIEKLIALFTTDAAMKQRQQPVQPVQE